MDCRMPGFPVLHHLLVLAQTYVHRVGDAIKPSHPLSSSSPPTFNVSQHPGSFQMCWDLGAWKGLEWKSTEPQSEGRKHFQGSWTRWSWQRPWERPHVRPCPWGREVPRPDMETCPRAWLGWGSAGEASESSLQKMAACWPGPKSSARKVDPTLMRLAR